MKKSEEDEMGVLMARVSALEDRAAIIDLLTSYGPAIDAGDPDAVARLWTEDGVYDVDTGLMRGRREIEEMVRGEMHQDFIRNGCAHVLETPHIRIDGDVAVATGKSLLVTRSGGDGKFTVHRATANRWELVRTSEGWRCSKRVGRLLDSRPESRQLLQDGLE